MLDVVMNVSDTDRTALRKLAESITWQVKEATMRRQFEQLVKEVRSGRPATTMFTPVSGADVDIVYDGLLAAANYFASANPRRTELDERIDAVHMDGHDLRNCGARSPNVP